MSKQNIYSLPKVAAGVEPLANHPEPEDNNFELERWKGIMQRQKVNQWPKTFKMVPAKLRTQIRDFLYEGAHRQEATNPEMAAKLRNFIAEMYAQTEQEHPSQNPEGTEPIQSGEEMAGEGNIGVAEMPQQKTPFSLNNRGIGQWTVNDEIEKKRLGFDPTLNKSKGTIK